MKPQEVNESITTASLYVAQHVVQKLVPTGTSVVTAMCDIGDWLVFFRPSTIGWRC